MMGDLYQHSVFLECHCLKEEHLTRLQKYFSIRRRSGGGECGPVTRVDKNVYSVAFKNKKGRFIIHRCQLLGKKYIIYIYMYMYYIYI